MKFIYNHNKMPKGKRISLQFWEIIARLYLPSKCSRTSGIFLLYFIRLIMLFRIFAKLCGLLRNPIFRATVVIWSVVENLPEDLYHRAILIVYWFAKVYCLLRLDIQRLLSNVLSRCEYTDFISFLAEEVSPHILPHHHLVLDNATIHHAPETTVSLEEIFGGNYWFSAPYSPHLKPIEPTSQGMDSQS